MVAYSKDLVEFIEKNRLKHNANEMSELIRKEFDKEITAKALRKYYHRHNLDYKKRNKGNYKCITARPIGFESPPDKNGLIRVKINEKQWQYKQRYLYEKYNNVKLDNDDYVIFADGDKTNFKKDNLIAVPKETARTFYAITKGEFKDKNFVITGLQIADIINKISKIKSEEENL